MDLLESILSKMQKPPTMTEQQKKYLKEQKQKWLEEQEREKVDLKDFREFTEREMGKFIKSDKSSIEFGHLDVVYSSIVQDVVETAGLQHYLFGERSLPERLCVIYRKDMGPSQEEINARNEGLPWNDEIAARHVAWKKSRDEEIKMREIERSISKMRNKRKQSNELSGTHYKAKYAHLIGKTAALDAAEKTSTNVAYGEVPSENKKDIRSIEQTMADIQAKKAIKAKLEKETQNK